MNLKENLFTIDIDNIGTREKGVINGKKYQLYYTGNFVQIFINGNHMDILENPNDYDIIEALVAYSH